MYREVIKCINITFLYKVVNKTLSDAWVVCSNTNLAVEISYELYLHAAWLSKKISYKINCLNARDASIHQV